MIPPGVKRYVTTYQPIAGWKAVLIWWNPEGFWEPWDTGICGWATEAEAIAEAQGWAEEENIPYLPRSAS